MKRTASEQIGALEKPGTSEVPRAETGLEDLTSDILLLFAEYCDTANAVQLFSCSTFLYSLGEAMMTRKNAHILRIAGDMARNYLECELGEHDANAWLRDGGLFAGDLPLQIVMMAMYQVDRGDGTLTPEPENAERHRDTTPEPENAERYHDSLDLVLPYNAVHRALILEESADAKLQLEGLENEYEKTPNYRRKVWSSCTDEKFDLVKCTIITRPNRMDFALNCIWLDEGLNPEDWITEARDLTCRCFTIDAHWKIRNSYPGELNLVRNASTGILRGNLKISRIDDYVRKGFQKFLHWERQGVEFHIRMIRKKGKAPRKNAIPEMTP